MTSLMTSTVFAVGDTVAYSLSDGENIEKATVVKVHYEGCHPAFYTLRIIEGLPGRIGVEPNITVGSSRIRRWDTRDSPQVSWESLSAVLKTLDTEDLFKVMKVIMPLASKSAEKAKMVQEAKTTEEVKKVWSCPADGMVHPWSYKGKQYLRNSDNEVWLQGEDGILGKWQGIFIPTADWIDDSVPEPVFDNDDDKTDVKAQIAEALRVQRLDFGREMSKALAAQREQLISQLSRKQKTDTDMATYTQDLTRMDAKLEVKVAVLVNGRRVPDLTPRCCTLTYDGQSYFAIPL